MWEAFAALLTIAGLLVRHWLQARHDEGKSDYASDKARFDQALVDSDPDNLSRLFDELRVPAKPGDGDPGGPDDPEAR